MRALLALVLLLTAGSPQAQDFSDSYSTSDFPGASSAPEFLRVEEAYQLAVEIEPDNRIRLHWQIAEDYYLYQHRFSYSLTSAEGEAELSAEMPPALDRTDEFFGEVSVYYRDASIVLAHSEISGTGTLEVSSQGCADAGLCYPPHKEYFELNFDTGAVEAIAPPPRPTEQTKAEQSSPGTGLLDILSMVLLAFVGGAILNLMPCVFPILSLKMLSFVRSADHEHHTHSWVYAAGVVCSFVLAAGTLLALQEAGKAIGWGFHLQSPGFVIALAYLFVVMALSLSGMIEFGSSIMGTGSELADRDGLAGSFFTGVLAVIVASPCTAPFMGTALGFAVTQPPITALGIFAALGAGMAAPMVLLSYSSGLRKLMPKPGPWMETLKQLLAFPLYATAIWLMWVAGRQVGVNTMAAAMIGALLIVLGLWLWRFSRWQKTLALVCLIAAVGLASWRGLDTAPGRQDAANGQVWSESLVEELRSAKQPVFIDVTADWCISCLANEKAVLHTQEISDAFASHGVNYVVADWTNYDADIAAFLKRHGRNGIPFYILYPADPKAEPIILPQLLTRSTVLNALSEAAPTNRDLATISP